MWRQRGSAHKGRIACKLSCSVAILIRSRVWTIRFLMLRVNAAVPSLYFSVITYARSEIPSGESRRWTTRAFSPSTDFRVNDYTSQFSST